MKTFTTKVILGIPFAVASLKEISQIVTSLIRHKKKKTFFYVNAHCLNIANEDITYKTILQNASLVYSGGFGPVLASRLLGKPLPERTPTPDFIDNIFMAAQKNNWSFYLLGGMDGVTKKAAGNLKKKFPKLKIAGYHHGYFHKNQILIQEINRLKPTVVLVGMGSPKQEKWIEENKTKIDATVFWAVGALFDVFSGKLKRAPFWMRKLELEWFYRLIQEPKRLWKRYALGNILLFMLIFKTILRENLLRIAIRGRRFLAKFILNASLIYAGDNRKVIAGLARVLENINANSLSKKEKNWIEKIEILRKTLENSSMLIRVIDYGRRSPNAFLTAKNMYKGHATTRTIGEICRTSSKSYAQAILLFKLIRQFRPEVCLELGTCLGISTAYQASALEINNKGKIFSIEGAKSLSALSRKHLTGLKLPRYKIITGRFQDILPNLLVKIKPVDFVFIDGHHDEKATIDYFNLLIPYLSHFSVIVLDDTQWSQGMERAWQHIKHHKKVAISVDLFNMGICVMKSQ